MIGSSIVKKAGLQPDSALNRDDCDGCAHYLRCAAPCLYLAIIRRLSGYKNIPRHERLAPPDPDDIVRPGVRRLQDYKEVLGENQTARNGGRRYNISDIRRVEDGREKIIIAALYARVPVAVIADNLGISERWVYELKRRVK